jgi:hypothetical protein
MGYKTGTVIIENQPGFQAQCDDKIIKQTGDFIIDPFDQYIFSGGVTENVRVPRTCR